MNKENNAKYLKKFGEMVAKEIAKYQPVKPKNKAERVEWQRERMWRLFHLEDLYRDMVWEHKYGKQVFEAFCDYAVNEKRSLLDARPYFRERQTTFTAKISNALRQKDLETLSKCHYNFRWIEWVSKQRKWGKQFAEIIKEIKAIREEMTITNIPLMINRGKVFHRAIQRDHVTYLDLIEVAIEGLVAAIDKFTPGKKRDFEGIAKVAVGRAGGNMIEHVSETLIHFPPNDKRKLYWINKARNREPDIDLDKIVEVVNSKIGNIGQTNTEEVSQLLQASSMYSSDYAPPGTTPEREWVKHHKDPGNRPDEKVEGRDLESSLHQAIGQLTIFEQKFLRMKGIGG